MAYANQRIAPGNRGDTLLFDSAIAGRGAATALYIRPPCNACAERHVLGFEEVVMEEHQAILAMTEQMGLSQQRPRSPISIKDCSGSGQRYEEEA